MNRKTCNRCGEKKLKKHFWADKAKPDGLCTFCKSCKYAANRQYLTSDDGRKATSRAMKKYRSTAAGKKTNADACLRYSRKFPDRNRARAAVGYEIKKGRLLPAKKFRCTFCPQPAQEYHHHNGYAKEHRLDVVPVCKKCHDKRTHS